MPRAKLAAQNDTSLCPDQGGRHLRVDRNKSGANTDVPGCSHAASAVETDGKKSTNGRYILNEIYFVTSLWFTNVAGKWNTGAEI